MVLWQGPFLKVTTLNRENATKKQTSIIFPSDNFDNPSSPHLFPACGLRWRLA